MYAVASRSVAWSTARKRPVAGDIGHAIALVLVVQRDVNDEVAVPPEAVNLKHQIPLPISPSGFVTEGMLRLSVFMPAWKQSASSASRRVSWAALVLPVCFLQEWMWSPNASMT